MVQAIVCHLLDAKPIFFSGISVTKWGTIHKYLCLLENKYMHGKCNFASAFRQTQLIHIPSTFIFSCIFLLKILYPWMITILECQYWLYFMAGVGWVRWPHYNPNGFPACIQIEWFCGMTKHICRVPLRMEEQGLEK